MHYDTRDVGKTAIDSNWFELARQDKEMNGQKGRKPHISPTRTIASFLSGLIEVAEIINISSRLVSPTKLIASLLSFFRTKLRLEFFISEARWSLC